MKGVIILLLIEVGLFLILNMIRAYFEIRDAEMHEIFYALALVAFFLFILTLVIFLYLTTKIEFLKKNEPSKKIDITAKNYSEFEENLKEVLVSENYEKEQEISNHFNCDIKYFIRDSKRETDILLMVHVPDVLTEEIRENYLEYCYEKIKEKYPKIVKKVIHFVHIVCVPEISDEMSKITEQGIVQDTNRYQLSVVVSFSNSRVYIAPPRNEVWSSKYHILKNRMIKYLDNQIVENKENR